MKSLDLLNLLCEICLWPHSSLLVLSPVEYTLGAPKWDVKVTLTGKSKVALPASWDGPGDVMGRVGREALEHFFFCMLSSHFVFSDAFSQMVGDTQRLYLQLYKSMIFGVHWIASPSRQASIGFQDLKFVVFGIVVFDPQVLDVDFFGFTPTEN